ncbi:PUA-like domain-containing protein [Mycena amicta]|nr:PUA-like domain-containing protein [Mycena amicta]
MDLDFAALSAVLRCSACLANLRNPTTLLCGHTVCVDHQTIPCPVPNCAPNTGPHRPRIPPASRVNYLPPPIPAPQPPLLVDAPKLDVTINKIIALLDTIRQDNRPSLDDDDDDEPIRSPAIRQRSESLSPPPRPRKRQRLLDTQDDDDNDLLSHLLASSARQRDDNPPSSLERPAFGKDLLSELSCEICFTLLYNPVTTPCQHTFCAKCLHRSLDHSNLCPLCRETLPGFSFFEDHPVNQTLETLIVTAFPEMYTERAEAIAAEERDARLDTPIFVCMLIFPGHPTALHFFEPRYRLMLRRCLEQEVPSFGMIMPSRNGEQPSFGTMVEIRSVQMLSDGRSMVETWSTYRFRILERGTLDGYTVGRIEQIEDVPDSPTLGLTGPSNTELMEMCTEFLQQLRRGTAPWVVQRLQNVHGPPPEDPAAFAYWVALILPIDDYEKAKLLPIRSARLRLRLVAHWIEQLNSNWWFASGCVVV